MKNKQTETKLRFGIGFTRHFIGGVLCLAAISLICARASAQNLFALDAVQGDIDEFTPNGVRSTFASGLPALAGLAFDGAGNLFVANAGSGSIYKFTSGGIRSTFALGLLFPIGLASDSAGNLFVADGDYAIYKFTPTGARTTFGTVKLHPNGLAFDRAGNLFVAAGGDIFVDNDGTVHSDGTVYKFTPTGVRTTFASGLFFPFALASDSAGNLFVADGGYGYDFIVGAAVYKFSPSGLRSTVASKNDQLPVFPNGLAIDSADNLFVSSGNIILKFTPSGMRTTFAARTVTAMAFQPNPAPPGNLSNISTRLGVERGDNVLIGGFVISGTGAKQVLVRALGPTLGQFGVTGVLQNPVLELHNSGGAVILPNDNWGQAPNAQSIPPNFRPPNGLESAILINLNPGAYTAIVRGVNNTTGVGLAEIYDLSPTSSSHLTSISARGFVQLGDDVMIAGVAVQSGSKNVLVRALGPTLAGFGISNPLANPTLELHDANGALISSNDNWKSTQQAEIGATGKAPPNDLESAITRTLAPGNYTAIVRGVNNTSGVALVEVYSLN